MNGFNENGEKHGLWEDLWSEGELFSRLNYFNGKLHGVLDYYFSTGILCSRRNYFNGKRNGLTEFYKYDGKLKTKQYNLWMGLMIRD
jgi:antitoxin component YwqK of YwqJK toxin-antitoxin module